MSLQESDADILTHVSRRLFAESREEFSAAHRLGMESFNAPTSAERLTLFGEALEREGRAFKMRREAIELMRAALDLRAKAWGKLKAT